MNLKHLFLPQEIQLKTCKMKEMKKLICICNKLTQRPHKNENSYRKHLENMHNTMECTFPLFLSSDLKFHTASKAPFRLVCWLDFQLCIWNFYFIIT